MIGKSLLTLLAATIPLSHAQISFSPDGTTVTCTGGGNAYCAGASLSSNIIIRCSGTKGQPGNCNDNLAFIPPVGVKTAALCYQTTPTSGDAACSFNGIVYPDTGPPFPINGTNATSSTSASIPTAPGPVIPITMTIASSIPTAPGLPTGLSATSGVTPRALSTISTGGYIPYSTAGAPYPIITSTKIMTAPTAGTGSGGATGGSSGVAAGATSDPDPSTSPITSSSAGVAVVVPTSVGMMVAGVVAGMTLVWWMLEIGGV